MKPRVLIQTALVILAPCIAAQPEGQGEAPPADDKTESYQLRLPGKPWAAAVAIPGFEIEGGRARPDGSQASVFAASESSGIILSMFLEQEEEPVTAAACRDKYFTRSIKFPGVWVSTRGGRRRRGPDRRCTPRRRRGRGR